MIALLEARREALDDVELPANVLVYRIDGPFFFGAAEKLERTLERVQSGVDTSFSGWGASRSSTSRGCKRCPKSSNDSTSDTSTWSSAASTQV
jgi:hypothetical protein